MCLGLIGAGQDIVEAQGQRLGGEEVILTPNTWKLFRCYHSSLRVPKENYNTMLKVGSKFEE